MSNDLKNEIIVVSQQADQLIISNNAEFIAVSEYMKKNKLAQKRVAELLDPNIDNLYKAHRSATQQKKELLQPLKDAHDKASKLAAQWLYQEEQRKLEEKKKLEEEAQKKADEEAKIWEDLGFNAEAKMAREDPIYNPIEVASNIPKTGVSLKMSYDFRIINKDEIKSEFKIPDLSKIGLIVRQMGFHAAKFIGGIEVFEKLSTRTRTGD